MAVQWLMKENKEQYWLEGNNILFNCNVLAILRALWVGLIVPNYPLF
jgi:hypothetical protein